MKTKVDMPRKKSRCAEKADNNALGRGKKRFSARVIVSAMAALLAVSVFSLSACNKKGTDWFGYFNNFSSSQVSEAYCTLNLSQKTYVSSFDPTEEVFITARNYVMSDGTEKAIYGLASYEKEYCIPYYTKILQIYGDYAVVARPGGEGEVSSASYLDVIRYRGAENDKPYSLMNGRSILYSDSYTQMSIVGDYVVVYGSLEKVSSNPDYAVFYNYTSGNELLEAFRVRAAYDSGAASVYEYKACDGFLVAYSTDRAYFYNLSDAPVSGYLEPVRGGEYVAFPYLDSLSSYERELSVYYLGNGWFVRTAMIYQYSAFDGFWMKLEGETEYTSKYVKPKTDFFNVKTGKSSSVDYFFVAGVANEYTYDYYTQQAYFLGSLHSYDEDTDSYDYNLPFANPAAMVREGYSIVYYYYKPYLEENSSDDVLYSNHTGETTFCVMDENLKRYQPEEVLMPTAYIDGVGVQTSDPYYTEITGTAYSYDRYMEKTVLATFSQGKAAYIPYYANAAACIVRATLKTESGGAGQFYGAVTPSGERITDFVYDELSCFVGGYAIGSKTADGEKKYYRIDEKGGEEEISDVLVVFQGTYSYRDGEKVGLKNYEGEILIPAAEGTVNVGDKTMTKDGKALQSFAVATRDDVSKIFVLR